KYFASAYDICKRDKYETLSPIGLLHHLDLPNTKWKDVTMVFVKELSKLRGYDSIQVLCD
nr:hypothetical protein [Vibrio vulnificus]